MNENTYLRSIQRLFHMYKSLGDKAMQQADDNKLHMQPDSESNSIAVVVRHMAGNMLSRWTDFYTTDGEKEWRNRDGEFEETSESREQLLAYWEKGWDSCLAVIDHLNGDDLEKTVTIRNEPHTVLDAVNRQLAHYSYHVGQLVYLCRLYRKDEWLSLSIPKNKSNEFNQHKGNFLDSK